jgi:dethiobiotin synthetase/adenosylmethionine--8-amino-7-oxononanoate aminotransferase
MIRSAARPFQSSPSASAIVAATHSVTNATHYIKPLQSGGSDERFVRKHCRFDGQDDTFLKTARTLFRWETPSSPHLAARIEKKPISDKEVLEKLNHHLNDLASQSKTSNTSTASSIWIETAGGVLSPAASSPLNTSSKHASSPPSSSHLSSASWGWMPQADLYLQLLMSGSSSSSLKNDENIGQLKKDKMIQVVLIGDGRLGGISATLSSLEALVSRRHYTIAGIVQICAGDHTTSGTMQHENDTNQEALKEYTWSMSNLLRSQIENQNLDPLWIDPDSSIVSVPALPPEPEPLTDWYDSSDVTSVLDNFVHGHLFRHAQSHIKN